MLKRCILAEDRKLHASPIWAMFFVLPILSATYGTFNYLQNLEILTDGWYSLWTQHTLFYSMLFFPAMVATYAAYLWRLEHLGHNWNLIMASPVRPMDLFAAKFVVVTKLALLTHAFVFCLYVFCGKVFAHLPGLPPVTLPLFLLRGLLGALAVIAAQLVLAALGKTPLLTAGRHPWHFCRVQRLFPALALRPDAGGHERQQKRGCTGRKLWNVFSQLRILAGSDVFAGMGPAAETRCKSVTLFL